MRVSDFSGFLVPGIWVSRVQVFNWTSNCLSSIHLNISKVIMFRLGGDSQNE